MVYRFLVSGDGRYRKEAEGELVSAFGEGTRFEETGNGRFFIMKTGKAIMRPSRKFAFVDNMVPLKRLFRKNLTDDELIGCIAKGLARKRTFRIEVLNIGLKSRDRAKDLEVRIGSALEKLGFRVDLTSPEDYVVICRGRSLDAVSITRAGLAGFPIDRFRNQKREEVSRAFYKLGEAFEYFGIDTEGIHSAIDIGAAPGGWSSFLSQFCKVVSVDNALLDYKRLPSDKMIAIATTKERMEQTKKGLKRDHSTRVKVIDLDRVPDAGDHDLLHVRASAKESIDAVRRLGPFDIATIDMNARPGESAAAANLLSKSLGRGAFLIMTVKLFDKNVERNVETVRALTSKEFRFVGIKKLLHNRKELTLCCMKR